MTRAICNAAVVTFAAAALAACNDSSAISGDAASAERAPVDAPADRAVTPATPPAPAEPETGLLASEEKLEADTVLAARYGGDNVGSSLLGVWAAAEPECGSIDQDDDISFAVVTPSSFRDAESRCTVALLANDATAEVSETCIGGGGSKQREILLESLGPDQMLYRPQPEDEAVSLVRCRLPQ